MKIKNYKLRITNYRFCVLLLITNCSLLIANDKLDVIVLDAGHGGKDPGTIGLSGIKEKNIVLPITLKLGALIEKEFPEVKVIYTRQTDEFPELKERPVLANQNKAKLFLSIHANFRKQDETDKNGFEIYILSKERFPEAVQITLKENLLFNKQSKGDETDEFIFSNLAHQGYLKQTEQFASQIEMNLINSTQLDSRGCLNAGFWVLVGSSMPAILVETGYLSDTEDEKYLSSEAGQEAVANSLLASFKQYKIFYEM